MSTSKPGGPPAFPFLLPGVLALILGLAAGLTRLPLAMGSMGNWAHLHGPLMVGGFLGTVIAVERAAALNKPWAWFSPVSSALGTMAMLFLPLMKLIPPEASLRGGAVLLALGGVFLVGIFHKICQMQNTLFNQIMRIGAIAYAAGNILLLLGRPVPEIVPWWGAFLVLTIAGERLELNRLMAPKSGDRLLILLAIGLLLVSLVLGSFMANVAGIIRGVSFILMAFWLVWRDIARRTIRLPGVTRYVAICLLSGYVWLFVSGVLSLLHPDVIAGVYYDAVWHTLMIGFVITMIFGHAPIIIPALTGAIVTFRWIFYIPLILLHLSLALRVFGDLALNLPLRVLGGEINSGVILLFIVVLIISVRRPKRV